MHTGIAGQRHAALLAGAAAHIGGQFIDRRPHDDDDVGEFGDVERELYSSWIPQPNSNVAVLNA
ncbi:MAG: hypothetical protein E2602_17380, partial [Achromobacter sp.]|nr:hypothetical protein [Achromobacter sp.]